MQQEIDELSNIINEITEELRILHLREAVLKRRLNRAVDEKCNLVKLRNHTGADNSTNNAYPEPSAPVNAVIVEEAGRDQYSQDNRRSNSNGTILDGNTVVDRSIKGRNASQRVRNKNTLRKDRVVRDRNGIVIGVGDEVKFLTSGINKSNLGEVHKITNKFVHCIDNNDKLTKRYPRNLQIVNKFHEC